MVRLLLSFLVLSSCAVMPALAQQPVAPRSPMDELQELLEATQARLEILSTTHWRFTGLVDLPVPGQVGARLFADVVDIYLDQSQLVATGNVAFTTADGRIGAERVEFNFRDGTATFTQAAGIMSVGEFADRAAFGGQDPDVYFWGDRIEKVGPKNYRITDGGFTACVQPTPRWEISSKTITLNLDDYAVARGTVLRVKGVPLLYLPALYYPLHEDDRSTGFLMPSYGTSTLQGGSLSNAFFWAIGRSQDATFFHDWYTRSGTGMGAEYRFLSGGQSAGNARFYRFAQGERTFDSGQTQAAKTTYQIDAAVNQDFSPQLKAQGIVEYFTDLETQQLYHQNNYQRSQSRRTLAGALTGNFGATTLAGYFARSEQFTDRRTSTVSGSLPRATAIVAPSRLFGLPIYGSLNSEYVYAPVQSRLDGAVVSDSSFGRLDLAPALRVPMSRLTYLSATTTASYSRHYLWPTVQPGQPAVVRGLTRQAMTVTSEVIGPVLSKIWDTPGSAFSDRMKHVIEPAFRLDSITDVAETAAPLAAGASASKTGLRFTYGLTNRLFARAPSEGGARGATREFVTVTVQQTYYGDPELSRSDSTYVSYSGRPAPVDLSPVALITRLSPRDGIDANGRIEYDVTGNGFQVFSAGGTFASGANTANVSFSRQRFTPTGPLASYLAASTALRLLNDRTTLAYSLSWDIDAGYVDGQSVTAAYMAQCCGIQAEFWQRNYPVGAGFPLAADRRFNLSFVLAGLGTFSNFFGAFGGQQ